MVHFPQARIDVRLQRDLVRNRGDWVDWYQGAPCPCGDERQGTDPTCQACGGTGFVYPIPAQRIRGIITQADTHKELIVTGLAQQGDMMFTQAPGPERYVIQEWDKIVPTSFVDGQPYSGDQLTRGVGTSDSLRYVPVTVQQCVRVDPFTGAATLYEYGRDFVTSGAAIQWIGANQPSQGERYTLKYRAVYEYVAFNSPVLRYERATSLGQRVLMRKRHLALRQLKTGEM